DDKDSLSNSQNEIYTIDLEQEIMLKAFVYEEQKVYVAQNKNKVYASNEKPTNILAQQGNISKDIDLSTQNSDNIRWAFKIVDGTYKKGRNKAFESLGKKEASINLANKDERLSFIPRGYVELEGVCGDLLKLKLSSLFDEDLLGNSKKEDEAEKEAKEEYEANKETKQAEYANKESNKEENTGKEIKTEDKKETNKEDRTDKESNSEERAKKESSKEERAKEEIKEETQSKLINKNIIFFAYDESLGINLSTDTKDNAYRVYDDKGTGASKVVKADRITSIELKIIKTRFRLEFDGQSLQFLENERLIKQWEARSGEALDNLKEDSKENKQRKKFALPLSKEKSFYYDENLHKKDNTKPLKEGNYFIRLRQEDFLRKKYIQKIEIYDDKNCISHLSLPRIFMLNEPSYNIQLLANQDLDLVELLAKSLAQKASLHIPLTVKYQKRILILIERFKESTESTLSKMNIYLDGKRVDRNGNFIESHLIYDLTEEELSALISLGEFFGKKLKEEDIELIRSSLNEAKTISAYELFNPLSLPNDDKNYAYILERPGPDSIGGELKLRVPEGRYDLMWNDGSMKGVLKLFNSYVSKGRAILIHIGNTAKNSDGCLLIGNAYDKQLYTLVSSKMATQNLANTFNDNSSFMKKYFHKEALVSNLNIVIINKIKQEVQSE
ncbi:DUF5675 family protein, partial [Campylobacter troglodytis]|uniref:DUF5675 family protein n=1 Tax=Campylobacter troglodytis TaxID=654363 RepID=UPI001C8D70B0